MALKLKNTDVRNNYATRGHYTYQFYKIQSKYVDDFKLKPIDEVIGNFFIKTLTTISGEPDYESLNEIIKALYDNIDTLQKILTGGKHGHVVPITKVTFATGTPWEYPKGPISIPIILDKATVAHHQHGNYTHGKAHQILENGTTMYKSLKHQVIEIIEDTYIKKLRNKHIGFM